MTSSTERPTTTVWDCRHCGRVLTYTTGWNMMPNGACYSGGDIRKHDWVKREPVEKGR